MAKIIVYIQHDDVDELIHILHPNNTGKDHHVMYSPIMNYPFFLQVILSVEEFKILRSNYVNSNNS